VPEEIAKGETKPLLEVTPQAGDTSYMSWGFVGEACTTEEEAPTHLAIALATHDWAWSLHRRSCCPVASGRKR
jgi:hypothetical protein